MIFNLGCSRSCETHLISFIQDLSQSVNQNIQTDIIIMDFVKAFDKVSHRHFLYKLSSYGVNINVLIFLINILKLLSWRRNFWPISCHIRRPRPHPPPPPIFFLIYINDFHEYLNYSTLRLFADNSIIQGITPCLWVQSIGFMRLKNSSAFFGHSSFLIALELLTIYFSGLKLSLCQTPSAGLNVNIDITSPGKYFFRSTVFLGAKSGKDEKLNRLDKLQKILDKQAGQALMFLFTVCCC